MNAQTQDLLRGMTRGIMNAAGVVSRRVRERGLDRWAAAALFPTEQLPPVDWNRDVLDVFIAICDHFEPDWGRPGAEEALRRATCWREEYPRWFGAFRDCSGRPPQHSFFYPQDEYRPECVDQIAELCQLGYGDVEIHLHHDHDTADQLREKLLSFRDELVNRHGLLRRDQVTGKPVYGFIHGNWALCNSRPDGRWCGVDQEIPVLLETGCYADFTFPSAPSPTQPGLINQIYYAQDRPGPRAHETGLRATLGKSPPDESLLMIPGPLRFDWQRKKFGLIPKVENADLLASHPPSLERWRLWVEAGVVVAGRPDWRFVKLHTHGCNPANQKMWFSERVANFHRQLAEFHRNHPNIRYHYVTAYEMAALVRQAEQGEAEPVIDLSLEARHDLELVRGEVR